MLTWRASAIVSETRNPSIGAFVTKVDLLQSLKTIAYEFSMALKIYLSAGMCLSQVSGAWRSQRTLMFWSL